MQVSEPVPFAKPVAGTTLPVPVARCIPTMAAGYEPAAIARGGGTLQSPRVDGMAIASAICGSFAIVPVISQVVGIVLGVMSLGRIRRAKRQGFELRGKRWAVSGIVGSGFVLICWIAIFVMFAAVLSTMNHSSDLLGATLHRLP